MQNTNQFREKIRNGQVCLGTSISFVDPTATEALCTSGFDLIWVDMEHNALSLETVQGHIMATKGTDAVPLVRVPWNDAALIKPVLDIGAAGVIVPMVRTADDVQRAVAACLYPPEGIRGYGPRRAGGYGRIGEREFCELANQTIITIVQIENVDAVQNLDEILAVPGLTSIMIGPGDLSASMGYIGQRHHPEVLGCIERIIIRARGTDVMVGLASGPDPERMIQWIAQGVQWVSLGNDTALMLMAADQVVGQIRERLSLHPAAGGT